MPKLPLIEPILDLPGQIFVGALLALVLASASYRLGLVTLGGALAMFCLGAVIFGFGGWRWAVPILVFFGLSNALSHWRKAEKARFALIFEKGNRRDFSQVLANGGMAGVAAVLVNFGPQFYLYYCASLAAATADTWATEIGTLSESQPRLITNFRRVATGTSGGVTLRGIFSAFLGALLIGASGWGSSSPEIEVSPAYLIGFVALSGLFGSLIDSILGATVQGQYRCEGCGQPTERRLHCEGIETKLVFGIRFVNNDWVNLMATASAFLFAYLVF